MKRKRASQSGFFNPRVLLGFVLGSLGVFLALVGLVISSGVSAQAQNQPDDASPAAAARKIAPEVLAETAGGKIASVAILLSEQADVSAAYEIKDHDARGWFVYNTLTQHASRTQTALQAFLTAQGVSYQSFWAANMIVATADRSLVESLAVRADVARIDSNRPSRWIEDPEIANQEVTPHSPHDPNAAEWGVQNVNAPAVWAMGFTGQGMVIGNQDTGTRWSHNALKPKYRGWNGVTADHNFNWRDAIHSGGGDCGANTVAPCDDHGHGTHTTGTTVGDDGAGNQVGVAPGAKWVACRNMNVGNGTPATYTECFQFMIAPTDLAGNNANPALRPHVLNNSWGCPASEGCVTRAELETIVNNTQAAGIFVVVSAGNSGSAGCSSVSDAPAIYSAAFSVGSITINNTLSGFSSRGPSTFYTPNLLKPNLSAPGSTVRSSTDDSDSSYGNSSGTSMAGPHVAGVVALLWSARPSLVRDIAATKSILQNTANPAVTVSAQTCGGIPSTQIPNNSFGYGRIDALAAVNAAPSGTPTPTPTATATSTPTATATSTPTATATSTPTATATATATPTATATAFPSPFTFPDLAVTKTDSADPVQVGSNLTYTITVSNIDPSRSAFATMTDVLPPGVNFVSATPSQGSCTGTSTITCDLGIITVGASATVSLVVTPTVAGTLSNTASVPNFEDPTPGNNADTEQTTVIPASTPPPTATPTPTDHPPSPTPSPTVTASPTATVAPTPTPSPAAQAINLSTRMLVGIGDNLGIGGFIVTGSAPKELLLRAIGPSLAPLGIHHLIDPLLELHGPAGFATIINNDWRDTQEADIIATGIPPTDDFESAILVTLDPGSYTAVVRGNGSFVGVALVEIYDLDSAPLSKLANISTRAFVLLGDDIVIAGFMLGGNSGDDRIVVRGIGPSLTALGVPFALSNPNLELRDSNGAILVANDDWQDDPDQAAELIDAGLAPTNQLESGIAAALPPGVYTALLAGAPGTGNGLVEVYDLGSP